MAAPTELDLRLLKDALEALRLADTSLRLARESSLDTSDTIVALEEARHRLLRAIDRLTKIRR
jgi:hypothetical protein